MRRIALALAATAALAGAWGCGMKESRKPTSEIFRETSVVREGRIAEIEGDRLLFLEAGGDRGMVLDLDKDTTIVEGGDFVERGELDEGDEVRVFYNESAYGPAQVLRIEVLGGEEKEELEERLEGEDEDLLD